MEEIVKYWYNSICEIISVPLETTDGNIFFLVAREVTRKRMLMDYEELLKIKWDLYKQSKSLLDSLHVGHPLKTISLSDLENHETKTFLWQLEEAFTFASHDTEHNRHWFDSKIKEIKASSDRKQVSSNLGELRAYSILKHTEFGEHLECGTGKGCDFTTTITRNNINQKLCIEVNTPLGRDDKNRTIINHGTTLDGNLKTGVKEYAPFGFPEYEKIDSIGSEAISMINRTKEDEKQFKNDAINILFVDYVNPFLSLLDIMHGHCRPFQFHNHVVYTGNIWWGMYSKKNETIFFEKAFYYPRNYRDNDTYKMPYDGKLVKKKSKVDFVIFNMYEGISILERLKSHHKKIPKALFLSLLTLPRLEFENLWINYPISDLKKRVRRTKKQAERLYKTASFLKE